MTRGISMPVRFLRKDVDNALTQRIASEEPFPMEDFLMHPDLPGTASKEAMCLITYLRRPDPQRSSDPAFNLYLHTLVDWALSDVWVTDSIRERFPILQPCRNAAAFLSKPFRRLWIFLNEEHREQRDYAFGRVLNFTKSEYSRNRVFAGHFQRILEGFMSENVDWISEDGFLKSTIEFAINNVEILAYQQLLCHFPTDFASVLYEVNDWAPPDPATPADSIPFLCFFMLLLEGAARESLLIHEIVAQVSGVEKPEPRATNEAHCNSRLRPLTRERLLLPLQRPLRRPNDPPTLCERRSYETNLIATHRKCVGVTAPLWRWDAADAADESDEADKAYKAEARIHLRKAQTRAYLLLTAVQSIITEKPEFAAEFQHSQRLLKLLLICGLHADAYSMVAPAAFRLLELLIYGDPELSITPADTQLIQPLIKEFAAAMVFTTAATPQMIAAFPIFWREPIAGALNKVSPPITVELESPPDASDAPPRQMPTWTGQSSTHPTPLTLYGRFLIDDPPVSYVLPIRILKALRLYEAECNLVREKAPVGKVSHSDYFNYQREVLAKDWQFLEFLNAEFPFNEDSKMETLRIIAKVFPLRPDHPYFSEADSRFRAWLNGPLVEFTKFWISSAFFTYSGEIPNQLSDFAPDLGEAAYADILAYLDVLGDKAAGIETVPDGQRQRDPDEIDSPDCP